MVSGRVLVDLPPFPLDRVCELLVGTGVVVESPEGAVVGP